MCKSLSLEYRVAKLEKTIKNEGKQVGTLYHVCTLDSYLKWILPNDTLQASGKHRNWIYDSDEYVSFTRDKFFIVGTKSVQSSKVLVQLVIDGDKLSEHYKIGPYNDFAFDTEGGAVDDGNYAKYREMEETCKGPIKNISKYIKEVRIDVFDMNDSVIRRIKQGKLLGKDVNYYSFIRGFKDKGFANYLLKKGLGHKAIPLDDAMKIFADYVSYVNMEEMLFSYDEDEIVKALKSKPNLNIQYDSGYPLEEYCTDDYSANIVNLLINAGADPNLNMNGRTAIIVAAEYGNDNVIDVLIGHRVNLEARDSYGNTPLMIAALNKNKSTVSKLISAGADVNAINNDGDTAMSIAGTKQIASMIKMAGAVV